MKRTTLFLLALMLTTTLTSSTTFSLRESAILYPSCPGPLEVYLAEPDGGKDLYPGERPLAPNTTYIVYMVGGPNSVVACVVQGGNYSLGPGTNCQDIGHYNEYAVATITTHSSGTGVTIGILNYCTSGNGYLLGSVYYELI